MAYGCIWNMHDIVNIWFMNYSETFSLNEKINTGDELALIGLSQSGLLSQMSNFLYDKNVFYKTNL